MQFIVCMRTYKCCRIKDTPLNEFSCLVVVKLIKYFYRCRFTVHFYYSLSDQQERNKVENLAFSL